MARWKLSTAHYINTLVDGSPCEWEYTENDRQTGRLKRRKYSVPQYLDPRDPADWNYKWGANDDVEGEIIVCYKGKGNDKDIPFSGDPTPDMIPIDDEAKAISASFENLWRYKPDAEDPGQYSQSLIDNLQEQMSEATSRPVEIPGLTDLVAILAKSVEQNQQLISTLTVRKPQ